MQKFLSLSRKMVKETITMRIASQTMMLNVRSCWILLQYLSMWKSSESAEETAFTRLSFEDRQNKFYNNAVQYGKMNLTL